MKLGILFTEFKCENCSTKHRIQISGLSSKQLQQLIFTHSFELKKIKHERTNK